MDKLDELESQSIYIIREANYHFGNLAMLWSIGKDSTTLLWLCRKAFFDRIPFPVLHIDTSFKFQEIYEFRDHYARQWNLDLRVARNQEAIARGMCSTFGQKLDCCNELKTNALKQAIAQYGFDGLLLGIRRDEHGIRAKERYFSPRNEQFKWNYEDQPPELWDQYKSQADGDTHIRIHPLLHWTEKDIWRYVKREDIPFVDLYRSAGGQRYRSIGCESCCSPVESTATTIDEIIAELETSRHGEREGRAQDKEDAYTMQKLRSLGYM
ncbi:MAG TPA: sulfate adenylyltransferase subunit CysD [Phycisphaerae bacterium]|nr:sulfate adenylyltransferase subunit CysD [Phycisphaerae bacterium]